jgi:hypothetical protein
MCANPIRIKGWSSAINILSFPGSASMAAHSGLGVVVVHSVIIGPADE